jgi:predicted PurR-regulated permease PerM
MFDKKEHKKSIDYTIALVNVILWLVIIAISVKLASYIKEILYSFATAILINYLFAKPVDFLTRFIKYRFISVFMILISFISVISIAIAYLVPTIITQTIALKNNIPKIVAKLDVFLFNLSSFFEHYQIEIPFADFNRIELLNSLFKYAPKLDYSEISNIASDLFFGSVFAVIYVFLTLIISFYLLIDGERAWQMFLLPFTKKLSKHLISIKEKIDEKLNSFLFGQFQIATMTALVMTFTYLFLNLPYAIIFGLAQFLEIIPVIGTWIAIVPCVIIISLTAGVYKGLIAFAVYMFYSQVIRDNFVTPRIMGSSLGFHPLAIFLALLMGAQLGGIAGVILAIPILAVITSIIDYNLELSRLKVNALS